MNLLPPSFGRAREHGSVFILVLWISFGLVVLALYFANAMNFELRAADNRAAAIEADETINGAARYVTYILPNLATNGAMPDVKAYSCEAVPVGDSTFWIIGRDNSQTEPTTPVFGLVDEASKLNLNSPLVTADMLASLPGMTVELAAAIVDWRDPDSNPTASGAEDEAYGRFTPARKCKNAPFETVDELRLVYGATPEILFGEDVNRNGILDPNENDGNVSLPEDNRDGRLDAGILEYMTVYSRQSNTKSDGTERINVNTGRLQLQQLLQQTFDDQRASQIIGQLGQGTQFQSVLEFYVTSRMTADEFAQIEGQITTATGSFVEGLVNVNTASETVLACTPGIGTANAPNLIAYRLTNPDQLTSVAWVKEVLDQNAIRQAGRYLTGQTCQFSADVAALGHHSRGFRRVRFVFETSEGTPKILYRQDLTHLGWALGTQVREDIQLAKDLRP